MSANKKVDRPGVQSGRRNFARSRFGGAAIGGLPYRSGATTVTQPFGNGERDWSPTRKSGSCYVFTTRPPHLETPFSVFNDGVITPNDAFFVRYHLANIPLGVDLAAYRLRIQGKVATELSLSMRDLKSMGTPMEVVAVNQCSGNSRGYATPRVFGAQLGNGSMGNARWLGVPLKRVLDKAGILRCYPSNVQRDGYAVLGATPISSKRSISTWPRPPTCCWLGI